MRIGIIRYCPECPHLFNSYSLADKKMVCDARNDGHTACREELGSVIEGKQGETAVTEEERSASCLSVGDIMEGESDGNLCR